MSYDSETYLSPFTWRYGSPPMRQIWSEVHKRKLMRRVWIALATAQFNAGLVAEDQLADLVSHQDDIDIDRAREIEAVTRHDVVAEIRTYAEQCQVGGGIIHWGVTSADITDNVDILRMREAARLLIGRLEMLLTALADLIERTAELKKALSEVKNLSGLLPICASCKKIRDDKGYWNQIEEYIRDHSEAEFTHSICNECADKLYPDFRQKNNIQNQE